MDEKLLQLPWQIQISLGIGYLCYCISYTGIRQHHKQIDAFFITICFSALCLLCLKYMTELFAIRAIIGASLVTLGAATTWRVIGINAYHGVLRLFNISWADDSPSAWSTLSTAKICVTQIAVLHEDGTWLRCDNAAEFSKLPFGPCQFGPNGDVALYLTHEEPYSKGAKQMTSTVDPHYGSRITYVPASKIKQVTIRYLRTPSRFSKAVAAASYRFRAIWARMFPTASEAAQ